MINSNKAQSIRGKKKVYAALGVIGGNYYAAITDKDQISIEKLARAKDQSVAFAKKWLKDVMKVRDISFVAIGFAGIEGAESLREELWLELDIVTHIYKKVELRNQGDLKLICYRVKSAYWSDGRARVRKGPNNQVLPVDLTDLAAYEQFASAAEFAGIEKLSKEFRQKKLRMIFINATAAGGGVAHMRHAMIRLYKLLGVSVKWYVLRPDEEIFNITKMKFHNILQAVAQPDCVLTAKEKEKYLKWIEKNAAVLKNVFKKTDVVVIDDPQPCALIPYIKKYNPQVKIMYRSHIQVQADLIDKKVKQQHASWQFLWQFIKLADLFISHPVPGFVPGVVKKNKLVYMPPSTDPLDGLNKPLKRSQLDDYMAIFQKYLVASGQALLDLDRPYFIQIARFDPSKGIHDVVESYRQLCLRLLNDKGKDQKIPQLIIVGNGSVDDPEGATIYEETRQLLTLDIYADVAKDIKVLRLPHHDQLLNALLSESLVAFQLSHKEGFEFKVSEALMKGRPVIAYAAGGIPLQIEHGKTGFLVPVGKTSLVAEYAYRLLDSKYYDKISQAAQSSINHDYWTLNNCAKWLYLALMLKAQNKFKSAAELEKSLSGSGFDFYVT